MIFLVISKKINMKKLLVLAVIGIAIKYFLESEQGEQLKQKIRDLISRAEDAINEKLEAAAEKIENTASRVDQALPGA